VSGFDGSNSGLDMIKVTGLSSAGTGTDLSFTDGSGNSLNGVDSGLQTIDGKTIYLYSDASNNNIVLGRAGGTIPDPAGTIVLALYLDETNISTSEIDAKIWSVLYEPLKQPDFTNPDDAVNLANKLSVSVKQDLEFSLANAPSGQNLFLMFTTATPKTFDDNGITRISDPAIIATGKDPANQSTGVSITTGDTINTSQGGGSTTFGTNNQMIVEGDGIRFSFVTGANQDMTIPNLDQNEADVEANINFTNVFEANSATFNIVQLQSGKSAVVKISAFNTDPEPGVDFIDGYGDDTNVAITNVKVYQNGVTLIDAATNSTAGTLSVNFNNGVVTISGVKAGYQIEYTADGHDRVLVENAGSGKGNGSAAFDIGGFKLLEVTGTTTEIGSHVVFEDDGPTATRPPLPST
jgi:hypothetical protein